MADLEAQRLANLKNKEKLLADLNLNARTSRIGKSQASRQENGAVTKKRKIAIPAPPTRASARLQQAGDRPSYKEEDEVEHRVPKSRAPVKSRQNRSHSPQVVEIETLEPAPDVDEMRDGWSKWETVGQVPTRDENGSFNFDDYPLFTPNKSPEEMIREGCFGGSYWRPLKSRRLGIIIQDDWKELPAEWSSGLDVDKFLINPDYNPDVNKYKVACGQSIEEWEASGWIMHEYDVRGWFQWYCRFFQGRRCSDDDRQVSRWRKCVGPTGRWKRMLLKAYLKMGVQDVFDDGEDEDTKEQHDLDEIWKNP